MATETTENLPVWFRPVGMSFVYAYGLVMTLLVAPFSLLTLPRLKRYLRACRSIERDASTAWAEEGPSRALEILERAFGELADAYPKTTVLTVYGKVDSAWAVPTVGQLHYDYLVQLQEWERAVAVAETMAGLENRPPQDSTRWQLSHAKCLHHLGRRQEALEILFRIRDPANPEDDANRLLGQWTRQ